MSTLPSDPLELDPLSPVVGDPKPTQDDDPLALDPLSPTHLFERTDNLLVPAA